MTTVDELWYLADDAIEQAQKTYQQLRDRHDDFMEFDTTKHVSRRRFRTVTERILDNGAPYGAHTLAYRENGELLLVRHEGVDMWVLPGGEADGDERFRAAAERELGEEAGVEASYKGLGMLGRVTFYAEDHATWGVLPIFEARVVGGEPRVADPDEEISDARFFADLPEDARDRDQLRRWRDWRLGETA